MNTREIGSNADRGDVGKRAAERPEGALGLVSERVREVDGACSGVAEEISRSGADTVRARGMQPMTNSHGSAGEIRRIGKEIACGRKDGCDVVQ